MKDENQFFDINQLPQEEGLLLFGISMNRIGNIQSPEKCFSYMEHLGGKIPVKTEGVGLVTLYSDYLYLLSNEPANVLRDRYKELMWSHKDGFMNLIKKDPRFVPKAFSFLSFGQVMLDNSEVFRPALDKVVALYRDDPVFKNLVDKDCKITDHGLGENERMFILEEITFFYLAAKGRLVFNNSFVNRTEQWILPVYPGKPLQCEAYLYQKNPLGLHNPKNKYENSCYDSQDKKVYDLLKLDSGTFN